MAALQFLKLAVGHSSILHSSQDFILFFYDWYPKCLVCLPCAINLPVVLSVKFTVAKPRVFPCFKTSAVIRISSPILADDMYLEYRRGKYLLYVQWKAMCLSSLYPYNCPLNVLRQSDWRKRLNQRQPLNFLPKQLFDCLIKAKKEYWINCWISFLLLSQDICRGTQSIAFSNAYPTQSWGEQNDRLPP